MPQIQLHDTRSGELLRLEPRDPGRVGIYACGPTVYSRIHIGNARPFVVFSLLKRFLEHEGYDTTLVVNVTDVNDKIYDAARAAGRLSEALAAEMTTSYISDTNALSLGRPDSEPLASETMEAIVAYIQALIDKGHAYESGGDVFFRVRSDPEYGSLSHRRVDDMDQGEGVEGTERKEDPLDFALWKGRKQGEDTWWDAPWGQGRTSSARRWRRVCSVSASTSTGAARISSSPIMRTRPPRRAPRAVVSWPGFGCTTA
jgi:cysteinyl-tRNA synthetase